MGSCRRADPHKAAWGPCQPSAAPGAPAACRRYHPFGIAKVLLYFREKFLSEAFRGGSVTLVCRRRQEPGVDLAAVPGGRCTQRGAGRGAGARPRDSSVCDTHRAEEHRCGTCCKGSQRRKSGNKWHSPLPGNATIYGAGGWVCCLLVAVPEPHCSDGENAPDVQPGLVCGQLPSSVPLSKLLLNSSALPVHYLPTYL